MNYSDETFGLALTAGVWLIVFVISTLVSLIISLFLYRPAAALPRNERSIAPGLAFLMIVPFLNLIWVFIFTNNLSTSYQQFFHRRGIPTDDCGAKYGLWWGICGVCGFVPCLNMFAWIGGLILMILYLVKVENCRYRLLSVGEGPIPQAGDTMPYATPTSPAKPPSKNPYEF